VEKGDCFFMTGVSGQIDIEENGTLIRKNGKDMELGGKSHPIHYCGDTGIKIRGFRKAP